MGVFCVREFGEARRELGVERRRGKMGSFAPMTPCRSSPGAGDHPPPLYQLAAQPASFARATLDCSNTKNVEQVRLHKSPQGGALPALSDVGAERGRAVGSNWARWAKNHPLTGGPGRFSCARTRP